MAEGGNMVEVYRSYGFNRKRMQTIGTLPAEHMHLMTDSDRFIIQNAGQYAGKGNRVFGRLGFRDQVPNTIQVYSYDGPDPIDNYTRSCIHALALTSLYDPEWEKETNPLQAETLGVIITILATYTSYAELVDVGLVTALTKCHYKVDRTSWPTIAEAREGTREVRESLADIIGIGSFDDSPQMFTIIALSTLILIGKNVTEDNREGWFKNRWRALAHISNVRFDVEKVSPPLLIPCQALYISASANQPIRSCLFRVMRTLASIPDNQNHVIFDRIVLLLQWAEMSHIWMIMTFIYEQNPDILCFPELNGPEVATMTTAIKFLKRYPREERGFLKLLYDHHDLKPLHSGNFTYFTAAAHAISAMTRSSMLNITSRFSEGVKAFQNKVVEYINKRNRIGPMASATSYSATLPEAVQEALLKSLGETDLTQEIPDFQDRQPEARE
nr:putative capsid protein [Myrmica rubra rhabdo-like virus 1]